MPFKEWDGIAPLTLHDDEYFWDEDGVLEYCEMNGMKPEDLRLVILSRSMHRKSSQTNTCATFCRKISM
jgi:hypothetical protein